MHGQLRIVKLLLRSKANINDINLDGNTAAHMAFQFKYAEVVPWLRLLSATPRLLTLSWRRTPNFPWFMPTSRWLSLGAEIDVFPASGDTGKAVLTL